MKLRIIVIGANAAGAKAAAKAKRMAPHAEITVVDRGDFVSYGACGIPYYVSDMVTDVKELMSTPIGVIRDPLFFRKVKGVEVRTATEAVKIDRKGQTVELRCLADGTTECIPYDRLVLATGSSPILPPLPGIDLGGIVTVKKIEDAVLLKEAAISGRRACVIGAGLIGLETVEALAARGMEVTLIELCDQILPDLLDPEMAHLLSRHLQEKGVKLLTSCRVTGFSGVEAVEQVLTEHGEIATDLVVLAIGVRPNVDLARTAGLTLGSTGAIAVDDRQRTSDPQIFSCGDCCETTQLVSSRPLYAPLGSTANKQGRVVGINVSGGDATFAGVVGTAILKVFDYSAGKTGLSEAAARDAGFDVMTVLSPAPDRAHFHADAKPIVLKLVADRASGRLLGLQAIGAGAVDKRIDAAAVALAFRASVDQVAQLDLAYAPPFAAAMDNLIVAADILKNKLSGEAKGITPQQVRKKLEAGEDFILLDVRSPAEHQSARIPGARLIPLGALRDNLETLPKETEIVTFCKISLRGYEAQKILNAAGFDKVFFMDGGLLTWPYEVET